MQINNFKELYFAELSELHDAEERLGGALSKMVDQVRHDGLKQALTRHQEEAQAHKGRIASILKGHDVNPDMHNDQAMARLVEEAEKMASILSVPDLRDAGLIGSIQKIAHYEIAAYGTAAAYAGMLGLRDEQATLHTMLEEERDADERLTLLAKQVVNPAAVH